jgi:hypothetical protein
VNRVKRWISGVLFYPVFCKYVYLRVIYCKNAELIDIFQCYGIAVISALEREKEVCVDL